MHGSSYHSDISHVLAGCLYDLIENHPIIISNILSELYHKHRYNVIVEYE